MQKLQIATSTCALPKVIRIKVEGWSGPKGVDDLCFHTYKGLGLEAGIWALRMGFLPQGWDLGLEFGIQALRLGFELGRGWRKRRRRNFPICVKA